MRVPSANGLGRGGWLERFAEDWEVRGIRGIEGKGTKDGMKAPAGGEMFWMCVRDARRSP